MAALLGSMGLWVLDCLDWWCTLISVAHEVFTQVSCTDTVDHAPFTATRERCACTTIESISGHETRR